MAFHVSCPITCKKICNCKLGFPYDGRSLNEFLEASARVQAIFNDPNLLYRKRETVQVYVPKVAVEVDCGGDDAVFDSCVDVGFNKDVARDEQGLSNTKVMCRLCFVGENEGSERARKMLSCKSCSKKYHNSCVKSWAQNRDLFHWSSLTCPSCRSCEVCQKTGDPNKLMFCKRCDDAYHCYCQQPPHKNVISGPYLCPKHTKCHSCSSTVPGNGLSVRWFLGYTCCDACGKLFIKGNYCPVCLKVYRDSESTPMVCCDICQRWVHCHCDGISDEKYLQFQVDNNLQYRCATCRGACYQVKDLKDAEQELWRRRDEADCELIASLRAAAGLPTQEGIFSVQPYSDVDDNLPLPKNENGHSLKFSLKEVVDKFPKKKSSSKKSGKKMGFHTPKFGGTESHRSEYYKDEEGQSFSDITGSLTGGVWSTNNKNPLVKTDRILRDQLNHKKLHRVDIVEETVKVTDKSLKNNGPKLKILLGPRNKNEASSPRSDAANLYAEQDLFTSNGNADIARHRANDNHSKRSKLSDIKGENLDHADQNRLRLRVNEGSTNKIRKLNPEIPDAKSLVSFCKTSETPSKQGQKASDDMNGGDKLKDLKPWFRLKFKNSYAENHTSWAPSQEDDIDKSLVKGQRSDIKRPPYMNKSSSAKEDETYEEDRDEIMDANWIIQKLGKDAIGKKVEVHQRSNDTWHKGTIREVFEGTSIVSVTLDDGKTRNVDLGKQGTRFYSDKHRRGVNISGPAN